MGAGQPCPKLIWRARSASSGSTSSSSQISSPSTGRSTGGLVHGEVGSLRSRSPSSVMMAPSPLSRIVAARSALNGVGLRDRILAVAGESLVACGGSDETGKDTDLRGAPSRVAVVDGSAVSDEVAADPFAMLMSTSSMADGSNEETVLHSQVGRREVEISSDVRCR